MKHMTKFWTGLIAAIAIMAAPAAMAQKVVYYDHSKVVNDSKAWVSVQEQLISRANEINEKLQPLAADFQKQGKALEQLTDGMTMEEAQKKYATKIKEFETTGRKLQAAEQLANRDINVIRQLAEIKINSALAELFDDVAKKRKADVLMRKTPMSYYDKKYDVTGDVLSALDKKLKTISLDQLIKEAEEQAKAAQAQAQAAAQ